MNANNSKDQLFYQLISDLAEDVMHDTQVATDQTINLSAQFLDTDSQNLVEHFQGLYECNDEICLPEQNTEDVDLILEAIKSNSLTPNTPPSVEKQQLSAVQQGVEGVIRKDSAIRAEISAILSSMQFAELLRQNLTGMCKSFHVMINSNSENIDKLKQQMQAEMHTFDERKAFYTHVMHQDMPAEDEAITQNIIDQLIG